MDIDSKDSESLANILSDDALAKLLIDSAGLSEIEGKVMVYMATASEECQTDDAAVESVADSLDITKASVDDYYNSALEKIAVILDKDGLIYS